MKYYFPKIPLLIIASSLFLSALIIWSNQYNKQLETITNNSKSEIVDFKILHAKIVVSKRLVHFINYLNQRNAHLKGQSDFQIKTRDRNYRRQLSHQTNVDTNLILLHHELATLQNSGLDEIDAQFLHFAHRNYQNPFTGQTITPNILASSNSESILMDIQGFCAGNYNPYAQSYHIDLDIIDTWIQSACEYEANSLFPTNP